VLQGLGLKWIHVLFWLLTPRIAYDITVFTKYNSMRPVNRWAISANVVSLVSGHIWLPIPNVCDHLQADMTKLQKCHICNCHVTSQVWHFEYRSKLRCRKMLTLPKKRFRANIRSFWAKSHLIAENSQTPWVHDVKHDHAHISWLAVTLGSKRILRPPVEWVSQVVTYQSVNKWVSGTVG
jgi:hypothetical protein